MNKQTNFSKSIILTSLLVFIITRFLGDTVLFIMDKLDNTSLYIWQGITCLSIIIITVFYLFYDDFKKDPDIKSIKNKDYFREISRLLIFLVVIFVMQFLLPNTITFYLVKTKLSALLIIDVISIIMIYASLYGISFIYKWVNARKHKKTKIYNRIIFIMMISSIITIYLGNGLEMSLFKILTILLYGASFILLFFTVKNNSWIAYLPKSQKLNLLWISLVSLMLTTWLSVFCLNRDTSLRIALYVFSPELNTLCGGLVFLLIPYLLRIFFATIGSLPTSDIVERRTYEIQSLTYLNRVVAETIDINSLIDTVTKLALNASGASSSWFESYSEENGTVINSSQFINTDKILEMHKLNSFGILLSELRKPLLIESIPEEEKVYPFTGKIFTAKSLIAIPLSNSQGKFGTLVVLHDEEYGFDADDLNVLTAFGNNVNIALENARLLVESLEKERFKRELMLARDMQYKLLPQSLPVMHNYSLSAFSLSAEEVGGDYYDIVKLKNGKTCILIGDVSGKGITAAFYMAQLKGVVLSSSKETDTARDILCKINYTLYRSMERQMYITLSAVVIDESNNTLTFSRAGHMPLIMKSGDIINFYTPKGIGIGIVDNAMFEQNLEEISLDLISNDLCLLFTDGVNELKDSQNNEYGFESLKQFLKNTVYTDAEVLINDLKNELKSFSKNSAQYDDMTVLGLICKK